MRAILVLAAFIALPLGEVAVFAWSGDHFGIWTTVGLVLLTAAVGVAMIRSQGVGLLRRAQAAVDSNASPQIEVIEGAGLALAGLFLITPGFLTDSLGFALLIPPLRRALAQKIAGYGRARAPGGRIVIDADFEEVRPADATAPTRSLDSEPGPR